jgi:hypothetical protein
MRHHSDIKRGCAALAAVFLPVLTASCLNPAVVNQTSGGLYPSAPGDEPFLLIRVINDTDADLTRVPVAYDNGTGPQTFDLSILKGQQGMGILLDWPVTKVTVGALDSALVPAITVTLATGEDVVIPSLINPAQANVDFVRGDTLVYRFRADTRNPAAITVNLYRIDGSTQQGPFQRTDTFLAVRQILDLSEVQSGTTTTAKTLVSSVKSQ